MATTKVVIVTVFTVFAFCIVSIPTTVKATDAASGSANVSTADQSPKLHSEGQLNFRQLKGIVSLEFNDDGNATTIYRSIPAVVAKILNDANVATTPGAAVETDEVDTADNSTSAKNATSALYLLRRRRATDGDRYSEDGIRLVEVDPAVRDGKLRVSLFAQDRDGKVLPAAVLRSRLDENKAEISDKTGHPVSSIYTGLPPDTRQTPQRRPTVWEMHWKMFLTVLILLAIAVVMLIVCCLCFYCCRRRKLRAATSGKPEPSKKPLADEQMVELTPIVPLQSAPQLQSKPNGNEEQPLNDDDNGWIVPIDQFSPDEMEQPAGVQISRL